ncbi:MAG: 1-acyl-sn-glycerol-3-phosphate acyltransferase [Roseiflexaceae bacterium]|nr:1-acyl-sn-glycerol-3-phosphate acyltransferase [Roseiflexaceae bacterium]
MIGAFMYFCLWLPLNIMRRIYWRWEVDGLANLPPKGTGIVLASNHLYWFDILMIGASLPLSRRPHWLGKSELFSNPVVSWWLRTMGVIAIKRGQRDLAALQDAEQALRDGALLIVFPEGHRSKTGGLIEGRGGAVRLAASSGAVIVPTALWGTEKGLAGLMRRNAVHIRFGPAFQAERASDSIASEKMSRLTTDLMLKIAELLPEGYRGIYRDQQDQRRRRQAVGSPE